MDHDRSLQAVVEILRSTSHSLRELAELSGRDTFTFYRRANLTRLDLSGQNMKGLNFDGADIRFSNLDGVQYDPGAFNLSERDQSQSWLADEFEFSLEDIRAHPVDELLVFVRLRPGLIDRGLTLLADTYAEFSSASSVSQNALRKARNGQVVAVETALKVLSTLEGGLDDRDELEGPIGWELRQPLAQFLSGGTQSKFYPVTKSRLKRLFEMRAEMQADKLARGASPEVMNWRDTPEYLEMVYGFYRTRMD